MEGLLSTVLFGLHEEDDLKGPTQCRSSPSYSARDVSQGL